MTLKYGKKDMLHIVVIPTGGSSSRSFHSHAYKKLNFSVAHIFLAVGMGKDYNLELEL